MEKQYRLVSLGEILVDFTDVGVSDAGYRLFEQNPGGAVANAVCAASKLGLKNTGIIGKVGDDMHGHFLYDTLAGIGVDTSGIVFDTDRLTTLAYVSVAPGGERHFCFARNPGADTGLRTDELNLSMLRGTQLLHVGSLSLTNEPAKSATMEAIRIAKTNGAFISYDVNYRKMLWSNEADAIVQMRSLVPYADFIKLSDEEMAYLTEETSPEAAIAGFLANGASCVVITMGKNGAYVGASGGICHVPAFSVPCVDATGAGDAFWGAFLCRFLQSGLQPGELTLDTLFEFVRFSNAAAALCVQKRGAIPALAPMDDVVRFLAQHDNP